jgi:hypothetical protein
MPPRLRQSWIVNRLWVLLAASALVQGCTASAGSAGAVGPTQPSTGGALSSQTTEMAFCVDEINRYRATIGLSTLARSGVLEGYATQSAEVDHAAGQPHQHFLETHGGGVALAEDELLLWPNGGARAVIQQGLGQMWAEGPGGDHYQNMIGPYSEVGCGGFSDGARLTVAQDFH